MKKLTFKLIFAFKLAKNCRCLIFKLFQVFKLLRVFILTFGLVLQGCSNSDNNLKNPKITKLDSVEGILMPESAYTMKDGRIIVSEIGEFGKDGDGKIVEVFMDGTKKIIADTGLNDPKGLLVEGPTIYVTDKDEVKKVSFNGEVSQWLVADDFPKKPQFLNDITIDRNTMIYISDSGDIKNGGGGAIYRVDSNSKISTLVDVANDSRILSPNGLSAFQRGYLAFNDFSNGMLFRVRLRDLVVEKLADGFGGADGLVYSGVNLYLSDWKGGKIWKLDISQVNDDGTLSKPTLLEDGFEGSADIDVTVDGKYLVIPEMKANKIVFLPL